MDDEYFRDVLLKYHRISDLPEVQPLLDKMFRAALNPRKRKYADGVLRNLIEVDLTTPHGIYIGRLPAFRFDSRIVRRAAARYAKGLHRYVFGYRIPDDAKIRVIINPEGIWRIKPQLGDIFARGKTEVIEKGIFSYSFVRPNDNPEASLWLLVFHNQFPILAYISPGQKH